MNAEPIRIMVVEDNRTFRKAISSLLNDHENFQCIAGASSCDEAFRLIEEDSIIPHIILLDLELPGMHGTDAIAPFLRLAPECRIVILTQSDRELHVLQSITRGASGYLLKTSTRREIFDSIEEVFAGGASIDRKVASVALKLIRRTQLNVPDEDDELLTTRELEVMQLLSEGLIKKEIAERLHLSPHAIDKRIRRIYEKLQVHNVAAAVAKALRKGWI